MDEEGGGVKYVAMEEESGGGVASWWPSRQGFRGGSEGEKRRDRGWLGRGERRGLEDES